MSVTDIQPPETRERPAARTVSRWLAVLGYIAAVAGGLAIGLPLAVCAMWTLTLLLGSPGAAVAGILIGAAMLAGVVWHVLRG